MGLKEKLASFVTRTSLPMRSILPLGSFFGTRELTLEVEKLLDPQIAQLAREFFPPHQPEMLTCQDVLPPVPIVVRYLRQRQEKSTICVQRNL